MIILVVLVLLFSYAMLFCTSRPHYIFGMCLSSLWSEKYFFSFPFPFLCVVFTSLALLSSLFSSLPQASLMEDKYLISQVGMTWETWHRKGKLEWKRERKYRVSKADKFLCVWEVFGICELLPICKLPKASDVIGVMIIDVNCIFERFKSYFFLWFFVDITHH